VFSNWYSLSVRQVFENPPENCLLFRRRPGGCRFLMGIFFCHSNRDSCIHIINGNFMLLVFMIRAALHHLIQTSECKLYTLGTRSLMAPGKCVFVFVNQTEFRYTQRVASHFQACVYTYYIYGHVSNSINIGLNTNGQRAVAVCLTGWDGNGNLVVCACSVDEGMNGILNWLCHLERNNSHLIAIYNSLQLFVESIASEGWGISEQCLAH
jgi:hypothetical protein